MDGMFHTWFQAGRFIPATFGSLFFNFTNSVGDLRYLRFISTAVVGASGGIIAVFVWRLIGRRTPTGFFGAVVVGVISLTTTSAASAATWATQATQMIALPLALTGGIVCTTIHKFRFLPWWFVSACLLTASAFCYQQFVPLAVLPVCMWVSTEYIAEQKLYWNRIVVIFLNVVSALSINAAYVFMFGDGAQERVLGDSLRERIQWFIGTYTPRTIDIFISNTQKSGLISLLLLGTLMAVPVLVAWKNIIFPITTFISWFACAAVAFPTQLWASYRLIHPAQIALWVGASFGLMYVVKNIKTKTVYIVAISVGLILLQQSDYRAYNYIAKPNHYDWETTQCEIIRNPGINTFVVNEWDVSRSNVYSYDEYGTIASNFDWVFLLSIKMAQFELFENLNLDGYIVPPVLISTSDSRSLEQDTFIVIDQYMCK
jgi:hypothetical protein